MIIYGIREEHTGVPMSGMPGFPFSSPFESFFRDWSPQSMKTQEKRETVGVVMPTRGVIFTKTMNAVMGEVCSVPLNWVIFPGIGTLPEIFNALVDEALKINPDYIWIDLESLIH